MERARTLGFHLENHKEIPALQLFAKLQHFGAATGLLDFTWNPLVALWFASSSPNTDGAIFAINTDDLVAMETFRKSPDSNSELEEIFQRSNEASPHLLFWEATLRGEEMLRILRQRSVFIIGRPYIQPDQVKKLIIEKDNKPLLLEELETLDITQRTLYPDLYGFCSREGTTSPLVEKFRPQDHLRQANEHYRAKAYQAAIAAYSRCIDMAPHVSETYFLRENAKSQIGLYQDAVQDYSLAIEHKDVPALGFDQDGLFVTEHWFLFSVYFNCGNAAFMLKDFDAAIKNFNQTISLSPNFTDAYFNRGNAYSEMFLWEDAISDYNRAWQLGNSPNVLFNKGNSLVRSGKIKRAHSVFREMQHRGLDTAASEKHLRHLKIITTLIGDVAETDVSMADLSDNPGVIEMHVNGYRGQPCVFEFAGNVGNTENMGGNKQSGGKGLPGRPGLIIRLLAQEIE